MRGNLAEHGVIAAKSKAGLKKLITALSDDSTDLVRSTAQIYLEHISRLSETIAGLTAGMKEVVKSSGKLRRLTTMPGVGVQTALAIEAFAPDLRSFKRGRDFSAWLGLVPKQHSTGGKDRLGKVSKMGQADIRRLLIIGAMSVIVATTQARTRKDGWLARMLERKPKLLVAITLANKMARGIWAMLTKSEAYQNAEAA